MSRTSVGVPAFSCSDFMADGAAGIDADSGRQELEGALEALDVLPDGLLLPVAVVAGDNVRMNSSTCSKHPRRISCYENRFQSTIAVSSFYLSGLDWTALNCTESVQQTFNIDLIELLCVRSAEIRLTWITYVYIRSIPLDWSQRIGQYWTAFNSSNKIG